MKRLIPATIILVFIITICTIANILVEQNLNQALEDINKFKNKTISAQQLQESWNNKKENLSIFVNHGFLDDISIYIGQLMVSDSDIKSPEFETTYKNIQTIMHAIKEDQRFAPHSFY